MKKELRLLGFFVPIYICGMRLTIEEIRSGITLLHKAAMNDDEETVRILLSQGVAVNETDNSLATALHYAAENNAHAVCALLLEKKANINDIDLDANPPIFYALINGHNETIRLLLQRGADLSILPPEATAEKKLGSQLAEKIEQERFVKMRRKKLCAWCVVL